MINIIKQNVDLRLYSHFKIGGTAKYFLEFMSVQELEEGFKEWSEIAKKNHLDVNQMFVIGGATNILFGDTVYNGLILKNSIRFIKLREDQFLEVGAGTPIKDINDFCAKNSLSGMEWSGGLPGTLGGAVFGNAGAFGKEMKDTVSTVESFDIDTKKIISRTKNECLFDYRNSIFKQNKGKEIIVSAVLRMKRGGRDQILHSTKEKESYRIDRQPLEYPNIGSIFKNIDLKNVSKELIDQSQNDIKTDPFPVIPAAYLISLAGLKGKRINGAEISTKHPNFIINAGGATSKDVQDLITLVQKELKEKLDVDIETEIIRFPW